MTLNEPSQDRFNEQKTPDKTGSNLGKTDKTMRENDALKKDKAKQSTGGIKSTPSSR